MHGDRTCFQDSQHFRAAEFGKQHVEQDDVGQFVIGDLHGLLAVGGGCDIEAGFGQSTLIGEPEKLTVLDQQHSGFHNGVPMHRHPSYVHRPSGGKP